MPVWDWALSVLELRNASFSLRTISFRTEKSQFQNWEMPVWDWEISVSELSNASFAHAQAQRIMRATSSSTTHCHRRTHISQISTVVPHIKCMGATLDHPAASCEIRHMYPRKRTVHILCLYGDTVHLCLTYTRTLPVRSAICTVRSDIIRHP